MIATWQRFCIALILSTGFALVWGVLIGWLHELRSTVSGPQQGPGWQQLVLLPDGELAVERVASGRESQFTYSALSGEPILTPVDRSRLVAGGTLWPSPPEFRPGGPGLRQRVFVAASSGTEHWYYVARQTGTKGRAYLVGYDTQTRRRIGYLARNGFQSDAPGSDDWLAVNAARTLGGTLFSAWYTDAHSGLRGGHFYLMSEGRLLRCDPATRSLVPAVERKDLVDAAELPVTNWSTEAGVTVQSRPILLRTPNSVLVFDPTTETLQEYLLPEQCRERLIGFIPLDEQRAAVELWGASESGSTQQSDVYVINAGGEVLATHAAVLQHSDVTGGGRETMLLAAVAVPAPLASGLLTLAFALENVWSKPTWSGTMRASWPGITLTVVVGIMAVIVTLRHLRRNRMPRGPLWPSFVFLFGLPGYVGYRLHRRFPQHDPLPPPERLGYEIFA
jgi:hypothetical protein